MTKTSQLAISSFHAMTALAAVLFLSWVFNVNAADPQPGSLGLQSTELRVGANARAEVAYAQPAAFQEFDPRQVRRWFTDFLFAPARARDREIVHAYNVEDLTAHDLRAFFEKSSDQKCRIAVIAKSPDHGALLLGGEHVYWGAPIVVHGVKQAAQDSQVPVVDTKALQVAVVDKRALKGEFAKLVALSSLQASGLRPPPQKATVEVDPGTKTYIASSLACLPSAAPAWTLVTNKAAWAALEK